MAELKAFLNKSNGAGYQVPEGGEIFNDYENNEASGQYSHAEGQETQAIGNVSHSEGKSTKAITDYTHTEGYNTKSGSKGYYIKFIDNITSPDRPRIYLSKTQYNPPEFRVATEEDNKDIGLSLSSDIINKGISIIAGSHYAMRAEVARIDNNKITCRYIGDFTDLGFTEFKALSNPSSDDFTFCVPEVPEAGIVEIGLYAHAEGKDTIAYGNYGHAEGRSTLAGNYGHAEGRGTRALSYGHAEGLNSKADGTYSHAEGQDTQALGANSHTEGEKTQALGANSHAQGVKTIAQGPGSHAEGYGTIPSGNYSHAEGSTTKAIGDGSHAEGQGTKAEGYLSHAEGYETQAIGTAAHTEGYGTIAEASYMHASGCWNKTIKTTEDGNSVLFVIGNGTGIDNRHDACVIDYSGNAWFAGVIETPAIILRSSTPGSTKKFKITVDDTGNLSTAEI